MGWTKRQLVEEAFGELALAGYDFDLQPEEMQTGLRRLDTLMATWSGLGLQIGYSFGTTPTDSDLDQDAGLPLVAVEAVYLALAIRIAAGKGKVLSTSTKSAAKTAYDALVSYVASDQVMQQQPRADTPLGAGAKTWRTFRRPFVSTPDTSPLQVDDDGGLDFTGT